MEYLEDEGFNVAAMRDIVTWLPNEAPDDPMTVARHPRIDPNDTNALSAEINSSRADPDFWMSNVLHDHGYSAEEAGQVMLWSAEEVTRWQASHPHETNRLGTTLKVLPYPGGRHPRTRFLDGAIDPQHGTNRSSEPYPRTCLSARPLSLLTAVSI